MILSDSQIHERLDEFAFTAKNEARPFLPDEQIRSASVDLRLSNTFWIPKNDKSPINLKPDAFGSDTVDRFKKKTIRNGSGVTLKPGKFVLCRTYESFQVPVDLVARLHSKSSYSRLGVDVASTGDFINPGWNGHMPLIIRNLTQQSIQLQPFTSIVQVCFEAVSGDVTQPYGAERGRSDYQDDVGGPSKIWRGICRRKLLSESFEGQSEQVEHIIKFGSLLNQSTLKLYLKSLPSLCGEELGQNVIDSFREQLGYLRLIYKIGGSVLGLFFGWVIQDLLQSIIGGELDSVLRVCIAAVVTIFVGVSGWKLSSMYNSAEELRLFRNQVVERA